MRRCFIFAHFDSNREIKDYIISELKLLKELGDVIFISDTVNLSNADTIQDLVLYSRIQRHFMYDAYSYKLGMQYLNERNLTNSYDILYFVNSSILFPTCDADTFKNAIVRAEEASIDIWGMCKSHYLIQSYWIGVKKHVYKDLNIYFNQYKDCTNTLINDWWKVNKVNNYVKQHFPGRAKHVDELTAKKWIYTVINLECGFSKFMISKGHDLYGINDGGWPASKLITKYKP